MRGPAVGFQGAVQLSRIISIGSFAGTIGTKKSSSHDDCTNDDRNTANGQQLQKSVKKIERNECKLTHQCSDVGIFVSIVTEDGNGNHSHRSTGYQQRCRLQTGIT